MTSQQFIISGLSLGALTAAVLSVGLAGPASATTPPAATSSTSYSSTGGTAGTQVSKTLTGKAQNHRRQGADRAGLVALTSAPSAGPSTSPRVEHRGREPPTAPDCTKPARFQNVHMTVGAQISRVPADLVLRGCNWRGMIRKWR
jgi:hypothetical protein